MDVKETGLDLDSIGSWVDLEQILGGYGVDLEWVLVQETQWIIYYWGHAVQFETSSLRFIYSRWGSWGDLEWILSGSWVDLGWISSMRWSSRMGLEWPRVLSWSCIDLDNTFQTQILLKHATAIVSVIPSAWQKSVCAMFRTDPGGHVSRTTICFACPMEVVECNTTFIHYRL